MLNQSSLQMKFQPKLYHQGTVAVNMLKCLGRDRL
jgi:hypothetical protein